MSKRAVLYARKSSKGDRKEEQSASVADQLTRTREYALAQGWTVADQFQDDGKSGLLDRKSRPGLNSALNLIESGGADVLVTLWTSRLSREERDRAEMLDVLDMLGVEWHATADGGRIDRSTYSGYVTYGINTLFDVAYSKRVGENWRRAHQRRIEAGLPTSGKKHFGYTYTTASKTEVAHYEINEVQAEALRTCYRRYADSVEGFHSLCLWLNAQGLTTTTGNTWKPNVLTKTMDSGFNVGFITTAMDVKGSHTPIIDESLWLAYKAQRKRAGTRGRKASGEAMRWYLAGLITCGECGSRMARNSKAKDTVYCRNQRMSKTCNGKSIKGAYVESAVRFWLLSHLDELDALTPEDGTRAAAATAYEHAKADTERVTTALADLETKHLLSEVTDDVYLESRQMLTERLHEAQEALSEAAGNISAPVADIEALRGRDGGAWTPEQIVALRSVVSRVEVRDGAVAVVPAVGEPAVYNRADLVGRCAVFGCERLAWTRNLCKSHTSRTQKAGVFEQLAERVADESAVPVTVEDVEKVLAASTT